MNSKNFSLNLSKIGQIAIGVSDIDRATEFYRDTLGMRFLFSAPPGMSFFDCDGVRLMLTLPEQGRDESKSSSVIYYTVEDVQQATETLKSRGVRFIGEPHIIHSTDTYDLWMSFFTDPDGLTLALMAEVAK
jgi:catechol 2,3-dioxygenase-like lactoylglutathione lyase family enzyme